MDDYRTLEKVKEIQKLTKKSKLRLLVTKECFNECDGCCNKEWDLDSLPIVDHYDYDVVMLTGGDPLIPGKVYRKTLSLLKYLKYVDINPERKVYIYTAIPSNLLPLSFCDGITLTIHTKDHMFNFMVNYKFLMEQLEFVKEQTQKDPSLRLHIFKGIDIPDNLDLSMWQIRTEIEWKKNCPLPKDEEFKRLKEI